MTSGRDGVTLRLFGPLRQLAGGPELHLEAEATTVKDALAELVQLKGNRVSEMIFDRTGAVWPSVILLINDEPAELREASPVTSGDVISILLPLAGG